MNREFLELYDRELHLLYEQAKEFAEEFPGVAERLGGLTSERMDPMITGLLEGTAFLAARVQLKIKHEFPAFTHNLLELLVPDYLAPTPSTAIITVTPPFAEPSLKDGMRLLGGSYLEARYLERERRVACRFRLTAPITLWPLEISQAAFFPSPASLQAMGLEVGPDIMAGMQISLIRRSAERVEDEPPDAEAGRKPDLWFSKCRIAELPVSIVCNESDAVRIYEKLFAHCRGVYFRYLNEFGDPVVLRAPPDCLEQFGFAEGESLFPDDRRVFRGFGYVRELFVLPAKFLGFRLTGLQEIMSKVNARAVDIIFAFDQSDTRLTAAVRPGAFSLFCAPIVNLFEMTMARVPVRSNEHEYHVVPDRSRYLDFEVNRILKVFAHYVGSNSKIEVYPLYSALPPNVTEAKAVFYTARQLPRRRTAEERNYGMTANYAGTDTFIALANHDKPDDEAAIAELSVRALCSNRSLAGQLPVGDGGADFVFEENTALSVACIAGPTPPAESIIGRREQSGGLRPSSTAAWRLISLLSLNHLGLTGQGIDKSSEPLRELLSLFADTSDSTTERRIRGILSVESRPIVRRLRQASGTGAARGIEITVTFDEKAYEGSGIFLYGAVLDRFFNEYAPVNNFVQTVIRSSDRGEIMRWPPRLGRRVQL